MAESHPRVEMSRAAYAVAWGIMSALQTAF
jgi:hypothetical protein